MSKRKARIDYAVVERFKPLAKKLRERFPQQLRFSLELDAVDIAREEFCDELIRLNYATPATPETLRVAQYQLPKWARTHHNV